MRALIISGGGSKSLTRQRTTPRQKAQAYNSVKQITPRNENQRRYLETIDENIVTFGVGPSGTGKTYLAMYQAVAYHWAKKTTNIQRIILTRPVVEAGERLGFLPGAIEDKMDPFMRPLYDSLYDLVGIQEGRSKIEKGIIEIAPIAFMRGRTFTDAFVIVDEAQNCTESQLKMLLTRIGENTKMVVSGDSSQSDLNGKSGLSKVVRTLANVRNIEVVKFGSSDIVRSEVVRDIVDAFGKEV